jgi:hypothetical protein
MCMASLLMLIVMLIWPCGLGIYSHGVLYILRGTLGYALHAVIHVVRWAMPLTSYLFFVVCWAMPLTSYFFVVRQAMPLMLY